MAQRKGQPRVTRGTATSTPDLTGLQRLEASDEAKEHVPSDVDAMGQDKRREVVGHSYGPSRKSQVIFFVAVAALVVLIFGGYFAAIAAFDQPPDEYPDKSPWSASDAEQIPTRNPSGPCGEPGNAYPPPADSPCAPAGIEGAASGAGEGSASGTGENQPGSPPGGTQ